MTSTTTDRDQVEAQPAKPKRVANAGTRKGNGAGHGGPAKGAGTKAARAPAFTAGNRVRARQDLSEGE